MAWISSIGIWQLCQFTAKEINGQINPILWISTAKYDPAMIWISSVCQNALWCESAHSDTLNQHRQICSPWPHSSHQTLHQMHQVGMANMLDSCYRICVETSKLDVLFARMLICFMLLENSETWCSFYCNVSRNDVSTQISWIQTVTDRAGAFKSSQRYARWRKKTYAAILQ